MVWRCQDRFPRLGFPALHRAQTAVPRFERSTGWGGKFWFDGGWGECEGSMRREATGARDETIPNGGLRDMKVDQAALDRDAQ